MPLFRRSIDIKAPVENVFTFHLDPANLERVSPPGSQTRVVSVSVTPLRVGARVTVRSVQMGMPVTLEAEIIALEENRMFEDQQVRGPFKSWRHRHLFEPIPDGTRLTDEVEFEVPGGLAGRLVGQGMVMAQMEKAFAHRQEQTKRLLEG
jgi:ligand-binding SRPBCC domain-containing protein